MTLTLQDKIALISTGASQRQIAATLGVSHQTLGRWLRSDYTDPDSGEIIVDRDDLTGKRRGSKAIPKEASKAIDRLYSIHKSIARDQAYKDKIPYLSDATVYAWRPIKQGEPNQRVFVEHAHFIRKDLRERIFREMYDTKKLHAATVGSVVNYDDYLEGNKLERLNRPTRANRLPKRSPKEIKAGPVYARMRTKSQGVLYGNLPTSKTFYSFYDSVEMLIEQKHEAHAELLADQYIFQLRTQPLPQNVKSAKTSRKANTKSKLTRK